MAPDRRHRIDDRAAEWSDVLRHRGGDPALRGAFEAWCAEDPSHAAAFARIDAAHRQARSARGSAQTRALLRQTHARIAARRQRRQRYVALAAGLAIATVVATAMLAPHGLTGLAEQARYALAGERLLQTGVGERRLVQLADGSQLTLNTASRAVVAYGDARRDVRLLAGQALFEVAHDPARPFVVSAGTRSVTALGTTFDVRREGDALDVLLIEGRVAVSMPLASAAADAAVATAEEPAPTLLAPGERLRIVAEHAAVEQADLARATSWRDGHLIFHGDRLDQVLAEVNRYRSKPLRLTDPALGELRISGVVNTDATHVFVETITTYYPLRIVGDDRRGVLLGPQG